MSKSMVHKQDKSCTMHKVVSTIELKKIGLDLLIHW